MEEKWDTGFQSFLGNLEHDAHIDKKESPREHAERLLGEVREHLDAGIQSREEETALRAKLAIALEVATDAADATLLTEARAIQIDIDERYA